jgi:trans-aconitate methyltransferase
MKTMNKITEETIVKVLQDYKKGLTFRAISKKYSLSSTSLITNWVKNAGLSPRLEKHNWNKIKGLLNNYDN